MPEPKSEFRNDSGGVQGVVVIENGKPRGIAVKPGDTIWLSEAEQIQTANAPRKDENNPFQNGALVLVTKASEIANRRTIGDPQSGANAPSEEEKAAAEEARQKKAAAVEAKKKQEAERAAKAQAQAEQPGQPIEEPTGDIAAGGAPVHGKRQTGEEVATPAAAAQGGAGE